MKDSISGNIASGVFIGKDDHLAIRMFFQQAIQGPRGMVEMDVSQGQGFGLKLI